MGPALCFVLFSGLGNAPSVVPSRVGGWASDAGAPAHGHLGSVSTRIQRLARRISPRSWRNLLALITPFVLGLGWFLWSDLAGEVTAERIQVEVLGLGALGLVAYLAMAAIRPLFVVLSGSLFSVAAGMIWGPVWGTALAVVGAVGSAALVFTLARYLGAGAVRDLAGSRFPRFAGLCQSRGFAFIFIATLGFLFPTDVVIAVAATAGVRARTVLWATTLGTLPGTIAMVVMGASVVRPSEGSWWFGGGAVLGLTLLALVLARWWLPRARGGRTPSAPVEA